MTNVVTPQAVERRLVELSKEVDSAHAELERAEHAYAHAKADYEIAVAKARLKVGASGEKRTVQEREAEATLACQGEYRSVLAADAVVRAARANANRLRTQVDIARSVGTSVRTSLEVA